MGSQGGTEPQVFLPREAKDAGNLKIHTAGEAEIKLGASAGLWEKGTYMLNFGGGEPRSSVRGRSEQWRHRG